MDVVVDIRCVVDVNIGGVINWNVFSLNHCVNYDGCVVQININVGSVMNSVRKIDICCIVDKHNHRVADIVASEVCHQYRVGHQFHCERVVIAAVAPAQKCASNFGKGRQYYFVVLIVTAATANLAQCAVGGCNCDRSGQIRYKQCLDCHIGVDNHNDTVLNVAFGV